MAHRWNSSALVWLVRAIADTCPSTREPSSSTPRTGNGVAYCGGGVTKYHAAQEEPWMPAEHAQHTSSQSSGAKGVDGVLAP